MSRVRDWISCHSATTKYTAFVVTVLLLLELVKL